MDFRDINNFVPEAQASAEKITDLTFEKLNLKFIRTD